MLISTGKRRLLLYNCRNGGKRCFNCKLNLEEVSQVLVNHLWNDCFNTLSWFNRSFQRKNSRHARALTIPLLLGSNWQLPYPNKVPSRRIRILQRVPQLQKFLLYCLDGHGWFKVQIRMGKLWLSGKFPWCHYFQVHELMGRTSKWTVAKYCQSCWWSQYTPTYSWGLRIPPTIVADETLHQCHLEPQAKVLQLPPQQGTHGNWECIWAAKGKMESTFSEKWEQQGTCTNCHSGTHGPT